MAKKNNLLQIVEKKIEVVTSKAIDPKEFFQDRKGLYIWSDFKTRIVAKAKPMKAGMKYKISSSKLLKFAYDEDIEAELPKKHIFTESEVCTLIAELISKQPDGQEGILLNTGYANIFYTPAFVVRVGWSSGGEGWGVYAWERDGHWSDRNRVFSPATVPYIPCALCPSCSITARVFELEKFRENVERILKI